MPLMFNPQPLFEAVSCFICGCPRVAATRHRMIVLVLGNDFYITRNNNFMWKKTNVGVLITETICFYKLLLCKEQFYYM